MVIALCAAMLLPFVPLKAEAKAVNNFDIDCFEGKTISIIGDSISTYEGVNNSTFYNANIGGNAVYYGNTGHNSYANFAHITWADTWWQQAIDALGMELCVNNAWSGSKLYTNSSTTADGWQDQRTNNLTNKSGTTPDIIAVYMGTNDCTGLTATSTLGTVANAKTMTTSSTPTNALQAYSVMLQKVKAKYPNAEIYCFTLLHQNGYETNDRTTVYDFFNDAVKQLASYYGCYVVDLYEASGVHESRTNRDFFLLDNVHPDALGMDAITNCFISSLLENSKYAADITTNTVTYDLNTAYVEVGNVIDGETFAGDVTTVVSGKPFSVKVDTVGISNLDVTVTMGGTDITDTAVTGNYIYIDAVTGDVTITAKDRVNNYYWVNGASGFTSNPDQTDEFTHNGAALVSGTHTTGVYGTDATSGDASYKLSHSIVLEHDRPWVLEFKMGGSAYAGGILAMSDRSASNSMGNTYIHANQSYFFLGYHNNIGYCNSGVAWTTIASELGSSAGADIRKEMLTFKLVNVVNSNGTNMPQLYVNGTLIGSMNDTKMVGADASHASASSINLSGKDFVFNYFGTSNHPLQDCQLDYVKVYENGVDGIPADPVHNFRWAGIGEGMTSAETDGFFTENALDQELGNGDNGANIENSYYSLNKPINLYHDRAWTLEFKAKGNWGAGSSEDPMLLSSCNDSLRLGITYLWRNSSDYIALGTRIDGQSGYQNYGVDMSGLGLLDSQYYTYRLENQITYDASGNYVSNMVWLYIDDVQIGAMNRHRDNNVDTDPVSTDDWVSGKDFQFNFIGNKNFPLNGVTFDYIQVWEDGGSVNTLRLEYLINTAKDDSGSYTNSQSYTTATWGNYVNALNAGTAVLSDTTANQTKVDEAVDAIIAARNKLVSTASATKIHSVEPITGGKAVVGMQTGIKVVTSPNVAQVCVGTETLIINSSEVQELLIDGAKTKVKVWMLSWKRSASTAASETYAVGAWTSYSADHTAASANATTSVTIKFSDKYAVSGVISTQPTKTTYTEGERFDPTGMVITITYDDGTIAQVTDYTYDEGKLSVEDKIVYVYCEGVTLSVNVTVNAAA